MENLFLGIIAGVLVVLAVFLIPANLQILRTAKTAEIFLKTTEESLKPLLMKLHENADKISQFTSKLDESVRDVQHLTRAIGETGAIIDEINRLAKNTGTFFSVTTSSFGAGLKTALSVLAQGIIRKGG